MEIPKAVKKNAFKRLDKPTVMETKRQTNRTPAK